MNAGQHSIRVDNPLEQLNDAIERNWYLLCCAYDATAKVPNLNTLFSGVQLSDTFQVAQGVLVNMLLEVMENIGRFSPWYTRPARAFGIVGMRHTTEKSGYQQSHRKFPNHNSPSWLLAPEAIIKWQPTLSELSQVIEANFPLIQAMLLVENLMDQVEPGDSWISAHCKCNPPREIQVTRVILDKGDIRCDTCYHTFT